MSAVAGPLVAAIAFGLLGFAGTRLGRAACANVEPPADGPRLGTPPVPWLIAGCGLLGAALVVHAEDPVHIAVCGILCLSLVGCWYADVACGIVPDIFTLVPLAAVLIVGGLQGEWWHAGAALVVVPFAAAALASRGRGMGWGDVKLSALGGAVLGIETALLAFAAACLAAVCVAWALGRRNEPIALAPYMVASICATLFVGVPR
jgi:prepilin signal peptidase PulO-like enzyme (type II secretory pathway)